MYVVAAGDTHDRIAELLGVAPYDLALANAHKPTEIYDGGVFSFRELFEGEELFVPGATPIDRRIARMHERLDAPSTMGDPIQDEINVALSAAQLPPAQIQSAITAYTGLNAGAQNSILAIVSGQKPSFTMMAPLLAAGLAATGVGVPVVAAIAAALPVLDAIAGIFSPPSPSCDWKVGEVCFSGKPRAPGPLLSPGGAPDPLWTKWADFYAETGGSFDPKPGFMADQAFPGARLMQSELDAIAAKALTEPLSTFDQFRKAYYLAWQANAEYAINGYGHADLLKLLNAVALAFNAVHSGTSPVESGSTITFGRDGNTYIGELLSGDFETSTGTPRTAADPLVINSGPPKATHFDVAGSSPSSSSGASTAAVVAVTGLTIGGIAAAIWYYLGRPLTAHAFSSALNGKTR